VKKSDIIAGAEEIILFEIAGKMADYFSEKIRCFTI